MDRLLGASDYFIRRYQSHSPYDRIQASDNLRPFGVMAPSFGKASRRFDNEVGIKRLALHRVLHEELIS